MDYPGRIIKVGEADARIVSALKERLNLLLVFDISAAQWLDPANPDFGPAMKQVVKLFQARHVDRQGRPLKQDGEIGSITWEALFGAASVPASQQPDSRFLSQVLAIAKAQELKRVREVPPNSNRGPQVDEYLKRAGVSPGLSWCCAFVYWCFDEAAKELKLANPMLRTAGCLDHWNRCAAQGAQRVLAAQAVNNPALVQAGMIFVMDHGNGLGHTGLVENVEGGLMATIEGNTDASRTREGGGVYRLSRKLKEINKGFIDYGGR
jgi:CHAP domain